MGKLGVLFIHGMGHQQPCFAETTTVKLRRSIDRRGVDSNQVVFKSVYWGDLLDGRQDALLQRMRNQADVDWVRLRRELVVSGLGDVASYLGPANSESRYYGAIHARIETTLNEMQEMLDTHEHAPVVIIAHSLGCAMMSNYLWDAQHETPWARGDSPLTRGETVAALITLGCNLPLFTLTLRPEEVFAVRVPGEAAEAAFRDKEAFREHAGWFNYYAPNDVLGYPLRPVSESYAQAVRADIAVHTGFVWNAHTRYWTDTSITAPVAKRIAALMKAI
jgi:hypothetical protein